MTTKLTRSVRRAVKLRGGTFGTEVDYVIEMSVLGVSFRRAGRRHTIVAPWREVLQLAERLAGDVAHREIIREKALRRIGR